MVAAWATVTINGEKKVGDTVFQIKTEIHSLAFSYFEKRGKEWIVHIDADPVVRAINDARKILQKGSAIFSVSVKVNGHIYSLTSFSLEFDKRRAYYEDRFDNVTMVFNDEQSLKRWLSDIYKGAAYLLEISARVAEEEAAKCALTKS